jgi:hypothetical protein
VRFYIRGYDQHLQIGPMSLSAAESVVRAMALAQRSKGSRVWIDEQGKLFVKEAGCALDALWIADEHDRVVNTDVIAEIGTSADMVAHQKTDRLHGP